MTRTRVENLTISFTKRNAVRRGPMSADDWNDTIDEISRDLSELSSQWNGYLRPLLDGLPDGTDDADTNAFDDGLDGQTMYVKADATASDTRYFSAGNERPNTIYEQISALYTYVDSATNSINATVSNITSAASTIAIADSSSIFDAENVEDALVEVKALADTNSTSFLPINGGSMSGAINMGGYSITFTGSVAIISGSGSPEGAVVAPVGSLYLRSDGGAGTSLYVKQSGTGNTGWAGK